MINRLYKTTLHCNQLDILKALRYVCFRIVFVLIGSVVCIKIAVASPNPVIVQSIGEYYHYEKLRKSAQLLFGRQSVFGKLLDAIDSEKVKASDVVVFFDFDSTIVINKDEMKHKAEYHGNPRGYENEKTMPKDFHDIKNMLFVLKILNERHIPWAVLTARPDEKYKGIEKIKKEFIQAGVPSDELSSFLSPTFQSYQINMNDELIRKFEQYKSNPKSRDELWKQGEILGFKLNENRHPAQEGNIILMAHMPKSWGIYYFLEQKQLSGNLPKFVLFIDDSKLHMIKMKESVSEKTATEKSTGLFLDLAPLNNFTGVIQFILMHYARQSDHVLEKDFFTSDQDLFAILKRDNSL